jgi:hypothetical protein
MTDLALTESWIHMSDLRIVNLRTRKLKTISGINIKNDIRLILTKRSLLPVLSINFKYAWKIRSAITFSFIFFLSLQIKAQCSLKTTKDPCDDIVTRSAYFENVSTKPSDLKLKIEENITFKDTTIALVVLLTPSYRCCFGQESRILIKSGNDIITLHFTGQTICRDEGEKLTDYAKLTRESVDFLKSHTISSIRVYYTNSYDDFVVRKQDYFIRTLRCF